jgi:hypothetical protein
MHSQLTERDFENYGDELIGMSQRAAVEALSPELQRLHAENNHLRGMAQRAQHVELERALDRSVPDWRSIYSDPQFAVWLALPDEYSGGIRSQLMRNAVAVGDAHRVIAFYRGFQQAPHAPAWPLTAITPGRNRRIARLWPPGNCGALRTPAQA